MDGWRPNLYKTRMEETTKFVESLHYVPEENWTSSAFSVLRAGKVVAGPEYRHRARSLSRPGRPLLPVGRRRRQDGGPKAGGAGGTAGLDRQRGAARAFRRPGVAMDPSLVSPGRAQSARRAQATFRDRRAARFDARGRRSCPRGSIDFFRSCAAANSARTFGSINWLANSSSSSTARWRSSDSSGAPKALAAIVAALQEEPGPTMERRRTVGAYGPQRIANPPPL